MKKKLDGTWLETKKEIKYLLEKEKRRGNTAPQHAIFCVNSSMVKNQCNKTVQINKENDKKQQKKTPL